MSINYRSGVGYGHLRTAPRPLAPEQPVSGRPSLAASIAVEDPMSIRTGSGSRGFHTAAFLTSQALARNSDIFKAGVDLAGVHLWGSSLDPKTSPTSLDDRRN